MMKYTPSALKMQEQRAAFSKSSLIFSIFTKSAEGDRCCFGVCRGVPNRTQVYIFKIFVLTIAQPSDGINCFLQLFLHKLRTCLFVRSTLFIFTGFCAVLTIRYFFDHIISFRFTKNGYFRWFLWPSTAENRFVYKLCRL